KFFHIEILLKNIIENFLLSCCTILGDSYRINLPKAKYISVFSTYNENRYFLDDIVYSGDDAELDHLKSGFTRVTLTDISKLCENNNNLVPQYLELKKHN
ncbi:hypothetical protein H3V10_00005, partial [Snodgrassella sp. W6238H14]|nr:hypothetical protein [Snodgrassella sp. W6238H14]